MPKNRYGVSVEGYIDNRSRLTISNEGIKNILVTIWKVLTGLIRGIKNKIVSFFKWLFRIDKIENKKLKEAKEKIDEIFDNANKDLTLTNIVKDEEQVDAVMYNIFGIGTIKKNNAKNADPAIKYICFTLRDALDTVSLLNSILINSLADKDDNTFESFNKKLDTYHKSNMDFHIKNFPKVEEFLSNEKDSRIISTFVLYRKLFILYVTPEYELKKHIIEYEGRDLFKAINPDYEKLINTITANDIIECIKKIPENYNELSNIEKKYHEISKNVEKQIEEGRVINSGKLDFKDMEKNKSPENEELYNKTFKIITGLQTALLNIMYEGCKDAAKTKKFISIFADDIESSINNARTEHLIRSQVR